MFDLAFLLNGLVVPYNVTFLENLALLVKVGLYINL